MKLYTEEELQKAIKLAQKCEHDCGGVYFEYEIEDVLKEITPIELPSDEEIEDTSGGDVSFEFGAKWMRDKIQGGNNEQQ